MFNFSQKDDNGLVIHTIKVRKLSYDTLSTEAERLDSVTPIIEQYIKEQRTFVTPKIKGFVNEYILLRGSNLYVFSQPIPEKMRQNSSGKQSAKFWRKIRRMKKRKGLHYFKIKTERYVITKDNKEITNSYWFHEIFEPYDHKLVGMIEEKIEGTEKIEKINETLAEYRFLGDTIFLPYNYYKDGNTNCNGNRCGLDFFNQLLGLKSYSNLLILTISNPSRINNNTYEFRFDLKKILENQVTIIKNEEEEFICNYEIKNRKIYIENPPIPQFSEGTVNSRLTRLRFNVRSTTYTYE